MTVKVSVAARTAMCNAIVDLIDGGASAGVLEIFTGSPPANCAAADTGTKLAILTFSDPAYAAAADGEVENSAITSEDSALATGTMGHFRVKDSNGNVIWQGTVGTAGSGEDLIMGTTSVSIGQVVAVTDFPFAIPESC